MDYNKAFAVFEAHLQKTDLSGRPSELYEPLSYTMSMGGKRIRPALLLMSASLFSDSLQNMLDAAVGLELFHNFTLVHDDIMDNAPLRRGKKTVHEKWNRDIAILSGDVMFVKACQLIAQGGGDKVKEILDVFHHSAILVCEGQQMDMNFEEEDDVSISQYLEMIEKKTAVLIGCALQMGAILGGASKEDSEKLYAFGKKIGIAFQLQDDILDAFATDQQFGKRIGGDIISDKKTFLLLKAREMADEKTADEIAACRAEQDEAEKVRRMLSVYEKLNIRASAEDEMKTNFKQGLKILEQVSILESKKEQLEILAKQLMHRSI